LETGVRSGRKRGMRKNMNVELRFPSTFKISSKNLCKYVEIYGVRKRFHFFLSRSRTPEIRLEMNKRIRHIRRISREENHIEKRDAFTTKRDDRVEKEKKIYIYVFPFVSGRVHQQRDINKNLSHKITFTVSWRGEEKEAPYFITQHLEL
jgi:hypothetical protein